MTAEGVAAAAPGPARRRRLPVPPATPSRTPPAARPPPRGRGRAAPRPPAAAPSAASHLVSNKQQARPARHVDAGHALHLAVLVGQQVDEISMVVGDQGALVGRADLPVPRDRRGQGEQALRDPDHHSGQGAAAVAFQPSWSLRVSKVPSIHWRQRPSDPTRRGSSARSGRSKTAPWAATSCSKSANSPRPLTWGVERAARDSNPQPPDP